MRTIIAGSRSFNDYSTLKLLMDSLDFVPTAILCGEAKGADLLGKQWALRNNIPVETYPAKWNDLSRPDARIKTNKYGKYDAMAGLRRNVEMADNAEVLIAFWDKKSPGTRHMIGVANEKGLLIHEYNF